MATTIEPYVATRAEMGAEANIDANPDDARWLREHPEAKWFGIDGETVAAFVTLAAANRWLKEIQPEHPSSEG